MKNLKYLLFIVGALLVLLPFDVKADTPNRITITSNAGGTDYPPYPGICGYVVSMIQSDAGGAYCIQGNKDAPTAGCVYEKTGIYTEDPGMVWLLSQQTNDRCRYHQVQGAIYRYIGMKGTRGIFKGLENYPYFAAAEGPFTHSAEAVNLSNQAMQQTSTESTGTPSDNAWLEFDSSTIEKGTEACEGDYIKTRLITIKGEGINWDTLKVTALEVPSAQMVEKYCSGQQCTFRMQMSLSAAQGHTSLTLRASAETDSYGGRYYVYSPVICSDPSPQELLFRGPGNTTKTASLSIPINPDACTDYSLDVSCGNCDTTGDKPSFIIQDTTNWSGILNSNKSEGNAAGYFDQYGKNGSGGCHVYCREEYRVYFPNEDDKINVDTGRYFLFNVEGDRVIGSIPNYQEVKVEKIKECQATEEYEVTDPETKVTKTEERPSASCMSQYDSSQSTPKAGATGDISINYEETYEDSVYGAYNPINLEINKERQEVPQEKVNGSSATYEVINWYELKAGTFKWIDIVTGESQYTVPGDTTYFRDTGTVANLPISYENYGVMINGENVGAYVGFSYKLPSGSKIGDAFKKDDNSYFKTPSTSNDNMYKKYVNNGCSDGGDVNLREQLMGSACAELYGYGSAGFCECARSKQDNKAGDCIANINSGLDSEYYQCEVLVCEEGQYVDSTGKCSDGPGNDDGNKCSTSGGKYYYDGEQISYDRYVELGCAGDPNNNDDDDNENNPCKDCKGGVCCPGLNMVCPDENGECPYPTGSIDVIYRTIDLADPFPGQGALNRDTGWNWCSYNVETKKVSCAGLGTGNPVVYDHIINNRNTEGESVYNKTPLYEYTMSASEINRIRDYNKDHKYSEWDMTCTDYDDETHVRLNDKYCASNFLNDNYVNVTGLCTKDSRIPYCAED